MKLYLLQHAEAKKEEEDPARPISERGWRDMDKMLDFLKGKGIEVSKIFHSGKLRTKQTAEKLKEAFNPTDGVIETDGLLPMDDPKIWVGKLEEEINDIVFIGHLPHLSKLASSLLKGDTSREMIRFRMGGVICIEKNQERNWSIQWIVTPDIIS